jgi:hypothetical protein
MVVSPSAYLHQRIIAVGRCLTALLVLGAGNILLGGVPPAVAGEPQTHVVDEIVATVGRTPILKSDLVLARLVHLVPDTGGETDEVNRSSILQARIHLELQYRDLEESGTLYRLKVQQHEVLENLVKRAGGRTALTTALTGTGLVWEDVEDLALRIAAVNAYVQQRLRPRVKVSPEELQTAYQEAVALELTAQNAEPPSLDAIHGQLHRLLVERKLNGEIERWLREARERLEVTVLRP